MLYEKGNFDVLREGSFCYLYSLLLKFCVQLFQSTLLGDNITSRGKGRVLSHGTLLLGTLLPEGHVWASIEGERVL